MDLVGTFPYLHQMARPKPYFEVKHALVTRKGNAITGKRSELTDSAAYTYPFGVCYASALKEYLKDYKAGTIKTTDLAKTTVKRTTTVKTTVQRTTTDYKTTMQRTSIGGSFVWKNASYPFLKRRGSQMMLTEAS